MFELFEHTADLGLRVQANSLEELLRRLPVDDTGELKPFEAVLRVKVTRGVPVESEIVALRSGKP